MSDKNRKDVDEQEKSGEIKEHELAKKIVKDVDAPGNVAMICGYIGKSSSEETIRLYANLEFNEYFEIKKDEVTGSKEVADDVLPFGGTCIFVNADADLKHVIVEVTKVQAKFLGGVLAQDFVRPAKSIPRLRRRFAKAGRVVDPITIGCVYSSRRRYAVGAITVMRTHCVSNCDTCERFGCDPATIATDCHTDCYTDCHCTYGENCPSRDDFCPEPE